MMFSEKKINSELKHDIKKLGSIIDEVDDNLLNIRDIWHPYITWHNASACRIYICPLVNFPLSVTSRVIFKTLQ